MSAATENPPSLKQPAGPTARRVGAHGQADRIGRVLQPNHHSAQPNDGVAAATGSVVAQQPARVHSQGGLQPTIGHTGRERQPDRQAAHGDAAYGLTGESGAGE